MYQLEMIRTAIFGIAAALIFMSSAMAQTVVESGDQVSAFDQLSPGGQKHANSLFDAQQGGEGGEVMSLDDIALAKQETGWGNVFKQMKADGLVQEKNFGQIVSGQGKTDKLTVDTSSTDTNAASGSTGGFVKYRRTKLVVTTAGGSRVVVGLKRSGSKSRSFAKGSDARKAQKASSRQTGRRADTTSGRGKISGPTAGRGSHASVSTGRSGGGGKSFGGGGKGKSK